MIYPHIHQYLYPLVTLESEDDNENKIVNRFSDFPMKTVHSLISKCKKEQPRNSNLRS